jgi:acyl carrier protein
MKFLSEAIQEYEFKTLLQQYLGKDIRFEDIKKNTKIKDLGLDFFDLYEFKMALEEEYNINIDINEKELKYVKTVGDLMNVIEKNIKDQKTLRIFKNIKRKIRS